VLEGTIGARAEVTSDPELRFYLGAKPTRITSWIAPGRVIVLLTVSSKGRQNEQREVERARRALRRCMNEHGMTGDK